MLSERVRELIQISASGNAGRSESEELQEFLDNSSLEEVNEAMMFYESLRQESLANHDVNNPDRIIQSAISIQAQSGRSSVMQLMRWSAAAVFIIVAGTFAWFLLNNKDAELENNSVASENTRYHNDVQPGTDKAILTTGNGIQFLLTEENKAAQAPEGVQVQDGLVDYRNVTEKDANRINTLSIPRGAQYKLILADGSKVWLNAATTLKFPSSFQKNLREVELTGEAYFEVAKNAEAPFIVKTSGMQVRVLGTHFNVNAYDAKAVKTSLEEGAVQLESGDLRSALTPGKKGILENGRFNISAADLNADLGWKNGLFVFNKTDIRTVMQQFERWYDVDVVYESAVPDKKFVGDLQRSLTLVQALKILELSGVHFTVSEKKITVLNQ